MTSPAAIVSDASFGARRLWAPAALFAATAALAMVMSPPVSLWTDEAITLSAAARTPAELWALLQNVDAVHGAYYAFMSGWVQLFGGSAFSVRLPSALAAGGTAVGVLMLMRLLASPLTSWIASGVCATLPRITWGGIEARPFVFSALAATWATYALVKAMRSTTRSAWVAYGLASAVGIAINIYVVLVVVSHAITIAFLARRRTALWRFTIAAGAAMILTSPVILIARSQQSQLGGLGDRNPLSIARKVLINQLFLGETPSAEAASAWFTRAWQVAAIVAAALGLAAMLLAVVRRLAPGDSKAEILAVAAPWLALPTAVVAGYAIVIAPIYQPRYLTLAVPAGAILIAAGMRTLRRRWLIVTAAVVYILAVAIVYASQRIPFAKSGSDWSAAAAVVAERSAPGEAVYFAPRDTDGPTGQAMLTSRRIAYAYPSAFTGLTDLTLERSGAETATLDGFSRGLDEVLPTGEAGERVWGLYSKKGPAAVRSGADALFREAGYRGVVVWDGPSTVVIAYEPAR